MLPDSLPNCLVGNVTGAVPWQRDQPQPQVGHGPTSSQRIHMMWTLVAADDHRLGIMGAQMLMEGRRRLRPTRLLDLTRLQADSRLVGLLLARLQAHRVDQRGFTPQEPGVEPIGIGPKVGFVHE